MEQVISKKNPYCYNSRLSTDTGNLDDEVMSFIMTVDLSINEPDYCYNGGWYN